MSWIYKFERYAKSIGSTAAIKFNSMQSSLKGFHEERRQRILNLHGQGTVQRQKLLLLIKRLSDEAQSKVKYSLNYVERLDYDHPGQSKEVYLSHPIRVANSTFQFVPQPDEMLCTIALTHNILEVTEISKDTLANDFSPDIATLLDILTVDRTKQWDPVYKDQYYKDIESHAPYAPIIKVLDKFDNLFLLCLNPDEKTRVKYLAEIEHWVLPMCGRHLPNLLDYATRLTAQCHSDGYVPFTSIDV